MILRDKLNKHFEHEYSRLNEKQRQAVDKIEGPVMVIAGPGTGKTQILAARIGKILLDTDTSPSTILCLTYTDAGAMAMRRRLLNFIGSDAYKVNIYTFHAFCNDVIQDNLSLFEKNELDPISDLEKIELLKNLIDQLPKNHPLKRYRGDVYYEMKNLASLFSAMKQEGWSPAAILESISNYITDLPNRDKYIAKKTVGSFKKGDVRTDKIEEEKEKMLKLESAVREYDRFQEMMRAKNRYDFDDMINWVIRAFENNNNLLLNYQERFQYILVDEYQDTSGSQNSLVRLLINYWEKPNIFVVGDDDQSIYRFQGANVENMQKFCNDYKTDLFRVVLTNNYRSTQPILDVSKTLISRNTERLISRMDGLSKDLIASHAEISLLDHKPSILDYETQRHEMVGITLSIQNLLAEGVEAGKIAVIYRENKYGDELKKIFRLRGIPTYSKRHLNLLEVPLAQKILEILEYIAAEYDIPYGGDEMLFEILHFDFFNIPPIEIAKLSIEVADLKFTEKKTSIRRLLYEKAKQQPRDLFDKGIHAGLKNASQVIEQLIGDAANVTLQTLLENIIRKAGILSSVMKSEEKIWQIQVLTCLFDFVKEETRRNPDLSLAQLIASIELMRKNYVIIPLVQVSGSEKGVNLLTAHGSKGLEFEYVFLSGSNASLWEKKRKPYSGFKIPDTIFSSKPVSSDEEELRRLFYVAITRAQIKLFITYAQYTNDGKAMEPSKFIAEILDIHDIPPQKAQVKAEAMAEFQLLQFHEAAAPEIEKMEKDFIDRILEKFVMNVTALNNYLHCPLEFYFKNLIRIPSPKNEATEFGSSVHFAIQRLFEKMRDDSKNGFPAKEDMLNDFQWYMHRHRESFIKEAFERRLEYGLEILSKYYDEYIGKWNKIVAIEHNIKNVVVNGVPLKGKLDKLEFNGKEVNVVDYKTGDPDKSNDKLKPPHDKIPLGGDYWRQAAFYRILVDNFGKKDWKVVSTEFDFVEPDNKKKYQKKKLFITTEDTKTVIQQITDTWNRIQHHDFYTGCGKSDCHYCNFIKTNELYTDLHEVEADEQEVQITM
ncbi:MAG TPA: ATP-dependent DNA helicase [Flavitalea sp.]|nr:ATP-dependent DNA helicase [Flavitalea sp.]